MPEDVTPQAAAAPAAQPAPQAVPSAPVQQSIPLEAQAAPAAEAAPTAPDVQAELETIKKRYADSSAEALRLYRENESLKAAKTAQPTTPQPQTYSPEQLETWKEQWLVEGSTKPERASEAAHQVRLIDAELRKAEISQYSTRQTASQAFEQLKTVAAPILNQFQGEFLPGSALLQETNMLYGQALQAGLPEGDMTKAVAALLALAKNGRFESGVAVKASQTATQNLNQALKSAAAAGSGAASQNAAPGPDFTKMNPKTPEGRQAFQEYRRSLGVGK